MGPRFWWMFYAVIVEKCMVRIPFPDYILENEHFEPKVMAVDGR